MGESGWVEPTSVVWVVERSRHGLPWTIMGVHQTEKGAYEVVDRLSSESETWQFRASVYAFYE